MEDDSKRVPAERDDSARRSLGSATVVEQHWWDKAKPYVEILALLTLCIYTWYTIKIFDASKDSADAAKLAAQTAADSLRPWIKIVNVSLRPSIGPIKTLDFHWPLTGKAVPPELQVKISVKNVGHSVAQEINTGTEFFFGKFSTTGWYDLISAEEQKKCKAFEGTAPSGAIGTIVFPSESWADYQGVGGLVRDTDTYSVAGRNGSYSSAALIVCVDYQGEPGTQYQTDALFSLYERHWVYIPVNVDADASVLELIRNSAADHAY